jgi:hypothetical protein
MQSDGTNSEKQQNFLCVATFLPLKSWKYMIPFQLLTLRILRQIKQTKGVINYAVKADLPRKHFWTASVKKDQHSLRSFMIAEPHATAVRKFSEWSGDGSAFVEWTDRSDSINWTFALKKSRTQLIIIRKTKHQFIQDFFYCAINKRFICCNVLIKCEL